jgi:GNAT superfamily N-acetyltransferase
MDIRENSRKKAPLPDPAAEIVELTGLARVKEFSELLDRAFFLPAGKHYFDDFPVWAAATPAPGRLSRLGALSESGQLMATAGVRLASLQFSGQFSGDVRMPVALIGAVATDERFRGKGLATTLVSKTLEWAKARGAIAALLWGSEHAFYGRLGFSLCGEQVLVPLEGLGLPICGGTHGPIGHGWVPAIFEGLRTRGSGLALSPEDQDWVKAHQNVEWFWLGPSRAPRAYAAVGRGIDMAGMIHEWGGEKESLLALLGALKAARPDLTLLGEPHRLAELGLSSLQEKREYLFLAKVLDPVRALHIADAIGGEVDHDAALGSRPEDLARLFFGVPSGIPSGAPSGTPSQPGAPQGKPPIPAWIWGLDAV